MNIENLLATSIYNHNKSLVTNFMLIEGLKILQTCDSFLIEDKGSDDEWINLLEQHHVILKKIQAKLASAHPLLNDKTLADGKKFIES